MCFHCRQSTCLCRHTATPQLESLHSNYNMQASNGSIARVPRCGCARSHVPQVIPVVKPTNDSRHRRMPSTSLCVRVTPRATAVWLVCAMERVPSCCNACPDGSAECFGGHPQGQVLEDLSLNESFVDSYFSIVGSFDALLSIRYRRRNNGTTS